MRAAVSMDADPVAEVDGDAVALEEARLDQREVVGRRSGEERAEPDAVVGRAGLLGEGDDLPARVRRPELGDGLEQLVPDHAVPHDHEPAAICHGPTQQDRCCPVVAPG